MKRETHPLRNGLKLCLLGMVFSTGVALASHYTDLRRIEPIHGDPAAGATKATVCFACHGANGNSIAPNFPRLAGQRPDYLYHRLRSFKSAPAADPYYSKSPMTALAAPLTDDAMRDLAAFFSSQPPTAGAAATPAGPEVEKGNLLFHGGDAARGIPPCQGCHGADANGSSTRTGQYLAYPSLRGQYAPYIVGRLSSFRDGRPHHTSNDMIMGGIAHALDDASIQAIAAWLNSLAPAPAF
ncbi:MAG TPA: c-type cytochrome [Steroidobacteraceae bacterium]